MPVETDNPAEAVPHLSTAEVERVTVCIRPFRPAGPRIDVQSDAGKTIIHHYGHGGSGWSLSWGTAQEVWEHAQRTEHRAAVVLGAGAIGLTTALTLAEAGFAIRIISRDHPEDTASARATGSWSPDSRVAQISQADTEFAAKWEGWARAAYAKHLEFLGRGVSMTARYELDRHGLERPEASGKFKGEVLLADMTPAPEKIDPRKIGLNAETARKRQRMTFDLARYTKEILFELGTHGAEVEIAKVDHLTDLRDGLVINCAGYGAKQLAGDETLMPVRGQIAWLRPDLRARYGVHADGITLLCRENSTLLQWRGMDESFGVGVADETPDRDEVLKLIGRCLGLFTSSNEP